ncbi:MAG: peptide deformylase [Candidatus Hydrogenedentes bacterium]|nr:peptide deformylase [Candidatus Hydrogenedentota bacterium]
MDVVLYPDDPLTQKAEPFDCVGPEAPQLAKNMIETMDAHDGVGLAGPQVGIAKRIFVLCEPDQEPMCFINPEILEMEGREEGEEGCLSMPGIYAKNVPRATRVRVKALDAEGQPFEMEAHGFLARIIQHEYDHLEGILFPDRLDIITRGIVLQDWTEVRQELLSASGE